MSGAGPGGTATGPDAILALEYAYYTSRVGADARDVLAETATTTYLDGSRHPLTGAALQPGINSTPAGTRYCVRITRVAATAGSEVWQVELTEQRPGEQPTVSAQTVTTRTVDGHTRITEITPSP